jgi:protein tyrosine phosphatase (PTP) superfamily phosphohydrolase (DUF442 family)
MLSDINSFYSYHDSLASGAQPSPEHLKMLRDEGFEAVVNISTENARNALSEEARIASDLNLTYIHFPVDCSNLQELHYNTFKAIMNSLEGKKTFVHCGANIKSSNLIHMYHVLEKGKDELHSFLELKKIQEPEEKWNLYFRTMGMHGFTEIIN